MGWVVWLLAAIGGGWLLVVLIWCGLLVVAEMASKDTTRGPG